MKKAAFICAAIYAAGFIIFMLAIYFFPLNYGVQHAQGVVVFTGDANRINAGFDAQRHGFKGPILISGVHPKVSLKTLLNLYQDVPDKQHIEIDYIARTTKENVLMTLGWAERKALKNIAIMTSDYHMPRTLLLFALYAPVLHVYPVSVIHQKTKIRTYWREYNKLLVAPLLK